MTGLLLITAAFFLTAYNLYDALRAERSAAEAVSRLENILTPSLQENTFAGPEEAAVPTEADEISDYILNPDMDMPVETLNGLDYIGILCVPALELELPVISEWSYPHLKSAPCRYSGSAYKDNLVIAAHNYASHFGNLKKLQAGDTVIFSDMDGNVFSYEIVQQETLQPSDIEAMENGGWDLTMFTCTTGGTSRVTVRCERVEPYGEK